MKILKYSTLAFAIALSSCGKGFLEIDPIGQVGKEQVFADLNGISAALTGSYNLTAMFFHHQYGIYGDLRADDVERVGSTGTATMVNEYNYLYNEEDATGATLNIWANGYEALNNINNVIAGVPNLKANFPAQSTALAQIEGEAHMLRALIFFALSNVYAQHYTYTADASHLGIPIPLQTPAPGVKIARATMKDTYAQIIRDLEKGISSLSSVNKGAIYASSDAAKGLLSRVYLYMGDYDNAIKYASEIITENKHPLASAANYKAMFTGDNQFSDFGSINSEVLWQFNVFAISNGYISSFYGSNTAYQAIAKKSFVDMFESTDVRKSMIETSGATPTYRILKNSLNPGTSEAKWPVNFKVIRSAEVILNRAEAYFHKQQYNLAVEDLKTIQARALNTTVDNITISYTTPTELLTLIKNERRKELAFESHRIYDILRYKENLDRGNGCNSSVCSITYPNDIFIMPIPQRELDANDLIIPNPTVNN